MAFIRKSKFRHVFGKALKKDQCYDALRISRSSWDSKFCAVNPKFVAVITESGGGSAFIVIPLSKVGRVDINAPMVCGHKGPLYDIAWSPHNDNLIASCSDDCTVKLWDIKDEGLVEPLTEPLLELQVHLRRVTSILWHPSAQNVLVSTGSDNLIIFWNLDSGEPVLQITMPDQIFSMSFNEDGSRLACTCKDKKLRVIDSHSGDIIMEESAHEGTKPPQCVFLLDNKIFTTGFSRMSERQYALWDTSKNSLSCITKEEIDSSNGVLFVFYDPDTSMIYLAGKGDSQIRYYEVTDEAPYVHYLTTYSTSNPQKGVGFMPKRGLNVQSNEIARFYKLHNNGLCEVTPFTVPRKSDHFQSDLYPDTASDEPAITADEFFAGKNALPRKITLAGEATATSTVKKESGLGGLRKSHIAPSRDSTAQNNSANGAAEAAAAVTASALPPGFDPQGILEDMRKLKLIVKAHERRIKALEEKLSQYESDEERVEDA